ncbi:MAG TPA: GtrA family protein, partial [Dehalococcoidia bacterium]|nr:GtrA family protein [Dehalococcoidia bacterium]
MTALARPYAAPRGAQLGAQVVRFLVTGGANTLLTLALYELLLLALPYWLAYAVAYAAGIVFAYVALGRFVFVGRLTVAKLVGHGSSYVVSYVLGLLLLVLLVEKVGIASWLAPILIILLLTPVNFIMSRLIFTRDLSFRSLFGRGRPTDGWLRRLPTLLAAFAGILVVLQFAPVASVRLVVDMTSSVAGESRVYVPSGKGGLSEGGAVGVPVAPGHNRLAFRLPSAPAWVRWDPVAGPGTFDIHAMALKVGGVLIPLRLERLAPAAQIAEWKPEGAGFRLKTEPGANDPSVVVPLHWKTAWLVRQGMLAAMAAALLAHLALAVALVRRRGIEPASMLPALAVTLVAALFASHGFVLLKYSVNVPYWDDWRYFINAETSYPDRLTLWWLFQYANDTI